MTTTRFTVALQVGSWSTTFEQVTREDRTILASSPQADVANVLSGLSATWAAGDPFPSQPTAVTCSFSVYVPEPDAAVAQQLVQGSRVHLVLDTVDKVAGTEPVVEFWGRVSEAEAGPLRDGLAFDLVCTDYTVDLAEQRVGDTPWPAEGTKARLGKIAAAVDDGVVITAAPGAPLWEDKPATGNADPLLDTTDVLGGDTGPQLVARDVDSQPTLDVLAGTLDEYAVVVHPTTDALPWRDYVPADQPAAKDGPGPALLFWLRPYIAQDVDDQGVVTFRYAWATNRVPDARGLPLRLVDDGSGTYVLAEGPAAPAGDGSVARVHADHIPRTGIRWRMDKSTTPNRLRVTGAFYDYRNGENITGYGFAYEQLVARNGPTELTVESQAADPFTARTYPLLGSYYDATPAYGLDSVTVDPSELPGSQWPRWFPFRRVTSYYSGHLGRFVYLYGMRSAWSPHHGGRYWGVLTGATVTVSGEGVRLVAQLLHREPGAHGVAGALNCDQLDVAVTVNQLDPQLRPVDLALVGA